MPHDSGIASGVCHFLDHGCAVFLTGLPLCEPLCPIRTFQVA
jgi:hypothetical protein